MLGFNFSEFKPKTDKKSNFDHIDLKRLRQKYSTWIENGELSKKEIATELMQTDGARLYHDQALFKEAGGGITPWHADQYYWPLNRLANDKKCQQLREFY